MLGILTNRGGNIFSRNSTLDVIHLNQDSLNLLLMNSQREKLRVRDSICHRSFVRGFMFTTFM